MGRQDRMVNSISQQSAFHGLGRNTYENELCITVGIAYRLIVIINTYEYHLLFFEVGHDVRVHLVGSETVGAVYVLGFHRLESQAQLSLTAISSVSVTAEDDYQVMEQINI